MELKLGGDERGGGLQLSQSYLYGIEILVQIAHATT